MPQVLCRPVEVAAASKGAVAIEDQFLVRLSGPPEGWPTNRQAA